MSGRSVRSQVYRLPRIGGLTRGTVGEAFTGGVIGAVAGGLIGAAVTEPRRCWVRTRSGTLRRGWCR